MSSEGSRTTSSSRLSQFGIYRSIDARTEEFLRLSRKRQLRQGCACAAVSTAITVTVVVTVLLIYEYTNLVPNPSTKSRMTAWHSIFNDTSPFELKYNKAKINIDPTTLKLLPLVLKVLNQNRYLEKIIKDSSYANKVKKDIDQELDFKKNIFDVKKLTQNIQTTGFRNVLPVGYKNIFNNLEYYKKIRQTKNKDRMLNYFDKMTNANSLPSNSKEYTIKLSPRPTSTNILSLTGKKRRKNQINKTEKSEMKNKITSQKTKYLKVVQQEPSKVIPLLQSKQNLNTLFQTENGTSPIEPEALEWLDNNKHQKKSVITQKVKKEMVRNPRVLLDTPTTRKAKTSENLCQCPKNLTNLLSKLLYNIHKILPEINLITNFCDKDNHNNSSVQSQPNTTPLFASTMKNLPVTRKTVIKKEKTYTRNETTKTLTMTTTKIHRLNGLLIKNKTNTSTQPNTLIITTIRSYIEPTYTTEKIEGYKTEPMNVVKSINIWNISEKCRTQNTHKQKEFVTIKKPHSIKIFHTSTNKPSNQKIKGNFPFFRNATETVNLLAAGDFLHSQDHDHLYIFPLSKIEPNSSNNNNNLNFISLIDWIKSINNKKKQAQLLKQELKGGEQKQNSSTKFKIEPIYRNKNITKHNLTHVFHTINEKNNNNTRNFSQKTKKSYLALQEITHPVLKFDNESVTEPNFTQNLQNSKGIRKNYDLILHTKKKNCSTKLKYKTTNRPMIHSFKYRNENKKTPASENISFVNLMNKIKLNVNHNISKPKTEIYQIQLNERNNERKNKSKANEMPIKVNEQAPEEQNPDFSHLSVQPYIIKSIANKTALDLKKEQNKTKRNSLKQVNITLINNLYEASENANESQNDMHTYERFSDEKNDRSIFSVTQKTDLKQNQSRLLFSKFAEINNLLYQTKNISNITIYEKLHLSDNFNHVDEKNTVAALEYDEFKFFNDEIREKELDIDFSEIDKYKMMKSKSEEVSSDSSKFIKSMLPVSRPIFLEIQRNDWKHANSDGVQDNENHDNSVE